MGDIKIPFLDDWHLHLRDGEFLEDFVWASAQQCKRALVMPNLVPPVVNLAMAQSYRDRIMNALAMAASKKHVPVPDFTPYMTLYLTQGTSEADVAEAAASGIVLAAKLYPQGATTHSQQGVNDIFAMGPVFSAMETHGMVLCIHGESTDPSVDIFDREATFISQVMPWIVTSFPKLKIVMEHLTTQEGVEFVLSSPPNIAATLTAHHLLCNRNDLFRGGLNPHYYCLPILKAEKHRLALLKAATSGNPKFFAGSDSAPHTVTKKECSHGCAGCYTSPSLVELYTEAFLSSTSRVQSNDDEVLYEQEQETLVQNLVLFLTRNGSAFYGLPDNCDRFLTLRRQDWKMPGSIALGADTTVESNVDRLIVPFRANHDMKWMVVSNLNKD